MGCDTYSVNVPVGGGGWVEAGVALPYDDSDIPCVCTFPHNNRDIDDLVQLEADEVRSLAYLGAMVAALHNGHVPARLGGYSHYITPDDLPPGTKEAIDKAVKA